MLDILFASSKGAQYRYYKALSKATKYKAKVATLIPTLNFQLLNTGLSMGLIRAGLEFHMERKRRKYIDGVNHRWLLGAYFIFSSAYFSIIYLSYLSYLKRQAPKIICLWNGHRLPEMAIKAAASRYNIKVAHFENGLLPGTTVMDFSGVNAFSSLSCDPNFYLGLVKEGQVDRKDKSLGVRKPHKKRKDLVFEAFDFNQKYIFVPFQVNFDSQVIINSPRISSMVELYESLEESLDQIEDEEIVFIIKEHPSDSRTYTEFHGKNPRIKFVNENTEDLIRNAQAIITLNSSVGIEASMLGKIVFVLGDACYAIKGVTTKVNSFDSMIGVLNNMSEYVQEKGLSNAFFCYLENEYLLPGAWQKEQFGVDTKHLAKFESKIEMVVNR